jgi:hypothetical protein
VCQDLKVSSIFALRSLLPTRAGFNCAWLREPDSEWTTISVCDCRPRQYKPAFDRSRYTWSSQPICAALKSGCWEHTFAKTVPVVLRTGVATEDELKGLLKQMQETAEDERVSIAQACLPGVVVIK